MVVTVVCRYYVTLQWLLKNARHEEDGDATPGPGDWGDDGEARHSVKIRRHLWEADRPGWGAPQHWSNVVDCAFGAEGVPPDLQSGITYDLVCASDVLYFHDQVGGC
jgi:hypothetical protein